jgi:uridine kinase
LSINCQIEGLTIKDDDGWYILRRSMTFLMQMAAARALPDWRLKIHHTLASGLYFDFTNKKAPAEKMDEGVLAIFEAELRKIIAADFPILRRMLSYEDAVAYFAGEGREDKVLLLQHHNTPFVATLCCDGFMDLHALPVVASTGSLGVFSLSPYEDGCVLNLPDREKITEPMSFTPQKELMRVHREHAHWGEILGVRSVGELNQAVFDRRISDVIMMSEALHNKNFAELASKVVNKQSRLVLIAGPSSAGKTTSAKRLMTHLKINGKTPIVISTDDYFVGDERNPIGPDGKPDYEHINALDLDNFNEHLTSLLAGKKICRRIFNFITKKPEFTNEELQLGPNDILIVEGIHGLNPMLTEAVPRDDKFMIYLSALTQLGIDDSHTVSTTDNRLIRRIVRDHLFRGHPAIRTLELWKNVRLGEERWIFPYQDQADASFNTALDYELAVLKPFADPLLTDIKPNQPEYSIARRLQMLLRSFHSITPSAVPGDSILREYIGGSLLKY